MKNFKKALFLLIDDELKNTNDNKENMDNLESLKNILNKSIEYKIEKLKEENLQIVLEEYLESKKSILIEDDGSYSLEKKYVLPLDLDRVYIDILSEINIDSDNIYNGELPKNISKEFEYIFKECNGYENDIFYIRPYNSYGLENCDCNCGLQECIDEQCYNLSEEELHKFELENISRNFHSKKCDRHDIYFYYKPTNLKIDFIKRPLYGATCNQEITKDILEAVLMDCVNSYKKDFKEKRGG